jgi:sulfur-oxidizing protein SoxY
MKRRRFVAFAGSFLAACGLPARAQLTAVPSTPAALDPAIRKITGGARIGTGRVKLEMPIIADNGNAVPVTVAIESPMSADDYVKVLHLVSDRNPERHIAAFHLGPHSGRAELSTRVRLAGSQTVTALAELSDGTFWMDRSRIQVTVSACIDESDWNK